MRQRHSQFDKRASIMRAAWKEWRYARMKGWHVGEDDPWTWARCVRFAAAQARARRPSGFAAVETAMAALLSEDVQRQDH
ncbi:MAG: hypothetical protein EKK29_08385 [Hyphomicrobiales bacterium]|nr:MAG: hypothetical protein EKK29_08385 [Hyphomicrobiales bacterium]